MPPKISLSICRNSRPRSSGLRGTNRSPAGFGRSSAIGLSFSSLCHLLTEGKPVAKRIGQGDLQPPWYGFNTRVQIGVVLGLQLRMKGLHLLHRNEAAPAWGGIPVMLAQVQQTARPRDLLLKRQMCRVAMLPIHPKAKIVDVKIPRLVTVKAANDRDRRTDGNCRTR